MAALVGEGRGEVDARQDVDARLGLVSFENGLVEVLALRVLHGTGELALFTADAPLGIYKDRLHAGYLLG